MVIKSVGLTIGFDGIEELESLFQSLWRLGLNKLA